MGRNYIGETNLSDHIAVRSACSKEYFEDLDVVPENLHVVGNLAWDVLPNLMQNRAICRAALAQANDQHWVVWGSTWNAWLSALDDRDDLTYMHMACESLAELLSKGIADAALIYKDRLIGISFEQARQRFMDIAAQHGVADRTRYSTTNALEWVASADVVVSYDSNLAIEAPRGAP